MPARHASAVAGGSILLLVLIVLWALWSGDPSAVPGSGAGTDAAGTDPAAPLEAGGEAPPDALGAARTEIAGESPGQGVVVDGAVVSGVVMDAATGEARGGVEVLAVRRPPGVERLFSRIRGLFGDGVWAENSAEPEIVARTVTDGAGRFELRGMPDGVVFLDARDDYTFVRTPPLLRVARGTERRGVELFVETGGAVRGVVRGPEGLVEGARVSLRPGLSAFLGQITERRYSWREARTGEDGGFVIRGVPPGVGYSLSAAGAEIALENLDGIVVEERRTTTVEVDAGFGAVVEGLVTDMDGRPVADAEIAMVYLDVQRVLFSADGRAEPIRTDAGGRFTIPRVAPGRVAFVAVAEDLAPSAIEERAVVEGGMYNDLELVLGEGLTLTGRVVDDLGEPVAGAVVGAQPIERPDDPDIVKLALRIRRSEAETDGDGRFSISGLPPKRLLVRATAEGHTGEAVFGARIEELGPEGLELRLTRHARVVGRVVVAGTDGEPVERFRVRVRPRRASREERRAARQERREAAAEAAAREDEFPRIDEEDLRRGGGPRRLQRGRGRVRIPNGARNVGEPPENGGWNEFFDARGRFEVDDAFSGRLRVEVVADGFRSARTELELEPGATSEELVVELERGLRVDGVVVEAATGQPVRDAEVTAYRQRDEGGRGSGFFRIGFDREDVDFLGLASYVQGTTRTAKTDQDGRFAIEGLEEATWRLTARAPDRPKASETDVELPRPPGAEQVRIELSSGGAVEGYILSASGEPIDGALVVAFNIVAGRFQSAPADPEGFYRIDGLAPGNYVVVRSRLDGDTTNLGYSFLGNLRLKSVRVRDGETTRFDIRDDEAGTCRVVGTVRDANGPVPRALVTALGSDREGILGLGIRAQPTDEQGRFELVAMKPGSYVFQVSRFQSRPEQANLEVVVPEDSPVVEVDLELPSSVVRGRVVGPDGRGIGGIRVAAGVLEGGPAEAPGLLGLILRNGVSRARTGDDGSFELPPLASGTYRITAGVRGGPGRRRRSEDAERYGEASVEPVEVDGSTPVEGLLLQLPLAASVSGLVVDGNGLPLAGAEITYERDGARRRDDSLGGGELGDLLGVAARPERSGEDGTFTLTGLTPGTYTIRADADGLSPGTVDELEVGEGAQVTGVQLQVVRGATLRVRARNVDGGLMPIGRIKLLDGDGKPVTGPVSVASVFRRLVRGGDRVDDSGWYEVGNVEPDTYTAVLERPDEPPLSVTRTIRDGEEVSWDIDVALELKALEGSDGDDRRK